MLWRFKACFIFTQLAFEIKSYFWFLKFHLVAVFICLFHYRGLYCTSKSFLHNFLAKIGQNLNFGRLDCFICDSFNCNLDECVGSAYASRSTKKPKIHSLGKYKAIEFLETLQLCKVIILNFSKTI